MTPEDVREAVNLLAKLENIDKLRRSFRGIARAKIVVDATEGSPAYQIGGEVALPLPVVTRILDELAEEARAELRRLGVEMEGAGDGR